jgi:predicted MFS family arabinose efflux permease
VLARWSPRPVLTGSVALIVLSLLWLARAPVPANYAVDLLGPLVVLGAALPAIFIVTTHQAVADVEPDDKGLASGIFETANHLLGGATGVAVYATVLAAAGYGAAFLVAAGLVMLLGVAAVLQARR